jgi:glutamine synthetase
MLRVIGSAQADGAWRAGGVRIENRIGEPLANPYLAIAVQVLAGLDGLRRGLTAPPACVDPYREPGKADDGAGPALPGSLTQSLAALESDRMLCEGLGPDLVTIWLAAQRQHLARRAASDDGEAFDRREYFRF